MLKALVRLFGRRQPKAAVRRSVRLECQELETRLVPAAGLLGEYFVGPKLAGGKPVAESATTAGVNYDWARAQNPSPLPEALKAKLDPAGHNFSVVWTGFVSTPEAGKYTFQTVSDDGVRLYVDGKLAIDDWTEHGPKPDQSSALELTAGEHRILMLYFENSFGAAVAQLNWQGPGTGEAFTLIPQARLSHKALEPVKAEPIPLKDSTDEIPRGILLERRLAALKRTFEVNPTSDAVRNAISLVKTYKVENKTEGFYTFADQLSTANGAASIIQIVEQKETNYADGQVLGEPKIENFVEGWSVTADGKSAEVDTHNGNALLLAGADRIVLERTFVIGVGLYEGKTISGSFEKFPGTNVAGKVTWLGPTKTYTIKFVVTREGTYELTGNLTGERGGDTSSGAVP